MSILSFFRTAKQNANEASVDANDAKTSLFKAARLLDDIEVHLNNVAKKVPEGHPEITKNVAISMHRLKNHANQMHHHIKQMDDHIKKLDENLKKAA